MNSQKKKVIFIDDDPINNIIVSEAAKTIDTIEKYHFFTSGWETLKYLKEISKQDFPDIIFVDLKMPEMDGFEFIEHYQILFWTVYPETKIYIATSSVSSRDKERSSEFKSVSDFLIKPLNKNILRAVV